MKLAGGKAPRTPHGLFPAWLGPGLVPAWSRLGPGFGPWSRLFSELHQTTKSFMTGSKWLQFEEWIFTKKWREACKLPVKVVIFPKSSKRDNPFAVLFRRSPCRGEPYGIDFCEKCFSFFFPVSLHIFAPVSPHIFGVGWGGAGAQKNLRGVWGAERPPLGGCGGAAAPRPKKWVWRAA